MFFDLSLKIFFSTLLYFKFNLRYLETVDLLSPEYLIRFVNLDGHIFLIKYNTRKSLFSMPWAVLSTSSSNFFEIFQVDILYYNYIKPNI